MVGAQRVAGGPALRAGDAKVADLDVVPVAANGADRGARSEHGGDLALDQRDAGAQREVTADGENNATSPIAAASSQRQARLGAADLRALGSLRRGPPPARSWLPGQDSNLRQVG